MHHGTCVTHVPWRMPGSLTSGFLWIRRVGKTFPAFPSHAQPAILRIWFSPGHTVPIWRSRSLRSEKSWTSAWSDHEVVASSYWHLGSLLGRETIGNDREASTTKFYCKTLSCWSWLRLRSIHGSISVVCGIGHVVGLSYPAWGHSWKACWHSWTAYG